MTEPEQQARKGDLIFPFPDRRVYPWHHLVWALHGMNFNRQRNHWKARLRHTIYHYEAQRYFAKPHRAAALNAASRSLSTGAGLLDYFFLHRYITSRKPKLVLELGSGVTTVIMAQPFAENLEADPGSEPGHLHTMEDIEKYYLDARELCPPSLRRFASYHLSVQKERFWRGGLLINRYEFLPTGQFDFIFADGPEPQNGSLAVNGDAFLCVEKQPDHKCDIALHGRQATCYAMRRYFRGGVMMRDAALNIAVAKSVSGSSLREVVGPPQKIWDTNILAHLKI